MLTVTHLLAVVLAATEFDDLHLVGATVSHHLGGNGSALQRITRLSIFKAWYLEIPETNREQELHLLEIRQREKMQYSENF